MKDDKKKSFMQLRSLRMEAIDWEKLKTALSLLSLTHKIDMT